MKEIGIVTLLSVAVTAAAPGPDNYRPSVYVTPKTVQDFASCFARAEDSRGAPWWFVPHEDGSGTLSNLGAKNAASYFIVVKDRGSRREIAIDQHSADAAPRRAVNQCL